MNNKIFMERMKHTYKKCNNNYKKIKRRKRRKKIKKRNKKRNKMVYKLLNKIITLK